MLIAPATNTFLLYFCGSLIPHFHPKLDEHLAPGMAFQETESLLVYRPAKIMQISPLTYEKSTYVSCVTFGALY